MDIRSFFTPITAEAHCDVPCGIYDPTPAKIAAKTVARMIDQLEGLEPPTNMSDGHALAAYAAMISRRVVVKERHAEECKRELQVLWSDFFKPEHLEKYPQLHDMFWKALKLASKAKQDPHKETAAQLVAAVDEIAKIFYEAKGDPGRFEAYQRITDTLY
jgi:nickel superoxide dismutase